jgi:hypothetical protein
MVCSVYRVSFLVLFLKNIHSEMTMQFIAFWVMAVKPSGAVPWTRTVKPSGHATQIKALMTIDCFEAYFLNKGQTTLFNKCYARRQGAYKSHSMANHDSSDRIWIAIWYSSWSYMLPFRMLKFLRHDLSCVSPHRATMSYVRICCQLSTTVVQIISSAVFTGPPDLVSLGDVFLVL